MIEISSYRNGDREEWDTFVTNHPEGRVCHFIGYRNIIVDTFGYEPIYLCLKRNGNLVGVFPSFLIKRIFNRKILVSQPFIEYGGLLANTLSQDEIAEFKKKILQLLNLYGVSLLQIHGGFGIDKESLTTIALRIPLYKYAILPLSSSEHVWHNLISRQARKAVRKAKRMGLHCFEETTENSICSYFYPLYLKSMKRLGSPPFSRKFFLNHLKYLSNKMKLFLARDGSNVVSALLGFMGNQRIHITFSVSDPNSWRKRPNDLVHWEFIRWACDNGYRYFDFGTVRYQSQSQFKEKWGVELRDFFYYYIFRESKKKVALPLNSSSRKIKFFSSLWRKYVPDPLAKLFGPFLHKKLGL